MGPMAVDGGEYVETVGADGRWQSTGELVNPGAWYRLRMNFDGQTFRSSVEQVPPPPEAIGPLIRCPFHDYEHFESGGCADCWDEYDPR